MELTGKVAVVTGAAGSIGGAIAEKFLQAGARVAFLDANSTALDQTRQRLMDTGTPTDRFLCVVSDVSNPESVRRAFETVDAALGSCDVAVANAGIAQSQSFLDTTPQSWQRTLDVNLSGVFYTCQQAAHRMMAKKGGSIITMSSTNGLAAEKNLGAYNVSKAGVLLLTKTIAIELAPYNIRANALNPGAIDTGLAQRAGLPQEAIQAYLDDIPMGRMGRPEEVAGAALFLASDASSFVTGLALVIDGGQLSEQ